MMVPLRYKWLVLMLAVLTAPLTACGIGQAQDSPIYSPDLLAMQGRWVRTDAPYVIELRQDTVQGLRASYYNPRPIHVEQTRTAREKGLQYVMIELQDVDYDGSTYLLYYDRQQDALQGIYTHGASGQRFQVSFSRQASR
jgi:hypothetical protein